MLSPTISQQEYSPLFERDRLGVVSDTEYLSRGAWTQSGAQFGTYENFSYDVEGFYRTDPGQRVNNDVEQRQFLRNVQRRNSRRRTPFICRSNSTKQTAGICTNITIPPTRTRPLAVNEDQTPDRRVWAITMNGVPVFTRLLFATRLDDSLSVTNPTGPTLVAFHAIRTDNRSARASPCMNN